VARCERFNRFLAARHAGFLTESALYTAEELKSDPFYRDILYPPKLTAKADVADRQPWATSGNLVRQAHPLGNPDR
jgi:hypothetical protein